MVGVVGSSYPVQASLSYQEKGMHAAKRDLRGRGMLALAAPRPPLTKLFHARRPPIPRQMPSCAAPGGTSRQTEFFFCHWNVENLFDDKNDGRQGPGDKDYDRLFADHPELLKLKLARLDRGDSENERAARARTSLPSSRSRASERRSCCKKASTKLAGSDAALPEPVDEGDRRRASHRPAILTRCRAVKDRTRTHRQPAAYPGGPHLVSTITS